MYLCFWLSPLLLLAFTISASRSSALAFGLLRSAIGVRRSSNALTATAGGGGGGKMAAPKTVTFVTGNENKAREVAQIMAAEKDVITIDRVDLDLKELQEAPEVIASEKCREAFSHVKAPVLVEDTSLHFNGLGGMPGPYVKAFMKGVGAAGLEQMLTGFEDKSAYAQTTLAFWDGQGAEPHLFVGQTKGTIVKPRGTSFGWDPIFQPLEGGGQLTYAEMSAEEKNGLSHRYKAFKAFKDFVRGGGAQNET